MKSIKLDMDYIIGLGLTILAIAVSPFSLEFFSGRADLPFRVVLSSGSISSFFLLLGLAALFRGRVRQYFFICSAIFAPFAIVAVLEVLAIRLHLANRILRTEDYSVLSNYQHFPAAHFLSISALAADAYPPRLRPFNNPYVAINSLGLRTQMPTPKKAREWRIAMTGGSTAWGQSVVDADTIPTQLQKILHRRGGDLTVLNFGMPGAEIRDELALLREFRDRYQVDQVIFYTGGNDTIFSYRKQLQRELGGPEGGSIAASFELFLTFNRLWIKLGGHSERLLARVDQVVLTRLEQDNSLQNGIVDAQRYCWEITMRCDFVLQPLLVTRKILPGREREMRESLELLYPRIEAAVRRMYAGAIASQSSKYVHDFSDAFDTVEEPLYFDAIHINELGNRIIAERLARSTALAVASPVRSEEPSR